MSQQLFVFVRVDLPDRPIKQKDYLAWLELGSKLSSDDHYFIHTETTKADFFEWLQKVGAITPT